MMKITRTQDFLAAPLALANIGARAEDPNTRIGTLSFTHDFANGSVYICVGPKAQAGFEKNWIPSAPGKAWFPYFRLYVPTEAHFDRTWILPDFEKVK